MASRSHLGLGALGKVDAPAEFSEGEVPVAPQAKGNGLWQAAAATHANASVLSRMAADVQGKAGQYLRRTCYIMHPQGSHSSVAATLQKNPPARAARAPARATRAASPPWCNEHTQRQRSNIAWLAQGLSHGAISVDQEPFFPVSSKYGGWS